MSADSQLRSTDTCASKRTGRLHKEAYVQPVGPVRTGVRRLLLAHLSNVSHCLLHAHELLCVDLHLRLDDVSRLRDDRCQTAGEDAAAEMH